MQPGFIGFIVIFLVLIYTIYLIRSYRLSAHMAMSWIVAEVVFLGIMLSDNLRIHIRSWLGEEGAPYSLFLLGALWVVFLMLESLTRISSIKTNLKEINQELALTRERLDRAEEKLLQSSDKIHHQEWV